MKQTISKGMVKWSIFASIAFLVLLSNVLFNASPNAAQENTVQTTTFESEDLGPRTQDITEEGNYTGVGQPLSAVEYADSTNASQSIAPFNSNSFGLVSVDLPPQWTGYKLFAAVSSLSDNRTWVNNGAINAQSPWVYTEYDTSGINSGGTNSRETCWGFYRPSPPAGTTTGALFLHNGYDARTSNHNINHNEYAQWTEVTYVNRSTLSAVRFEFDYWLNHTNYGAAQFFVELNGIRRNFPFFQNFATNWTWLHQAYDLNPAEIASITTPGSINITCGIDVLIGDFQMTHNDGPDGYTFQEIYIDNITMLVRGNAKPSQLQLKVNNTAITDMGYGSGNLSLNGNWNNPSTTDFLGVKGNFTTNETGVQLMTSFKLYATRSKQSQTLDNVPGSTFWVSNNTGVNWTAFYYAYNPYRYENYNFTISFPTDWIPWVVYDPTPSSVMADLIVGSGYIRVDSTKADRPGFWRIEFGATNFVTQLKIYRNGSMGPTNWVEASEFLAGDYLNVTAILTGVAIGTTAQLNLKFPDGTLWSNQFKQALVPAGGKVIFSPIQLPFVAGPDYVVGDYDVFVTWNNSISGSACNETGMATGSFAVRHRSKLIPDTPVFENLVQHQLVDIYVSFLDEQSDAAITGGTLWFTNTTGQIQTMTMISPGYYYSETNLTTAELVGEVIISINGNDPLYVGFVVNISLRYSILTSLVTNTTELTVAWGDNFYFGLNFSTQFAPFQGIESATITTDWDSNFYSIVKEGDGNYTIVGDSSSRLPNRLYTLLVQVDAPGFISKSTAFSVNIVPREAFLRSVYINGENVTLSKSIDLAVTSNLTFAVQWWDLGSSSLVDNANIQIVGIGSTSYDLTRVGNEYQCFIPGTVLNLGTHYITLAATRQNFTDSTMPLEIQLRRINTGFNTMENTNSYSIDVDTSFTLGVYVLNLDFGGTITSATVEYSGSDGSEGVLTEQGETGYYSVNLGTLPEGTFEYIIRVYYLVANYEYKEYTITVNVAPVEGLPPWLLYLTIGALAGVMAGIFSYVFYFRFPPSVRQARALKRNVKKGRTRQVIVKSLDNLLAEDYLNQSQGLLPVTTQTALKNRYLKEQKAPKSNRDASSLPSTNPVDEKKAPNTGGNPQ